MTDLALFRVSLPIGGKFVKVAATAIVAASLAALGCEDLSGDAGATQQQPPAANAGTESEGLETEPGARSALGKAKERAERLVNEEVAEYNRKLEEAAEGRYP